MITNKINTRHWFFFVVFTVALVLALIGLALSIGPQYHVVAEEFRLVFSVSMLFSSILLIFGMLFLGMWSRKHQ